MKKTAGSNGSSSPTRARRATLKTISDLTGLSLSTVSLSLRGGTALKAETRRKVAEAAASVGYVPDRAGVRLRTGKTNVLALVLDGGDDSIDFARQMIQGIGKSIKGSQYHLTVTPEFNKVQSVDSVRYILENRTADGVVLTHTSARDARVQMLMDAGFPFVTHGRTEFFSPHPYHDFHSELFAQLAAERLAAKGCRSVMLMIGVDRTYNYHNIVTAFHQVAARLGIQTSQVVDRYEGQESAAKLREYGRSLATDTGRPDGIICDSEMRAVALISGLQSRGVTVGRDIELLYKQTSGIVPILFPTIDSIEEDVFAAGLELTRLLLRRIDGEDPAELQTLSEPLPHWRS